MALPPAVWHRVANATDLWDCSACGFTATSMQQATHNSWHNQLATAIQKAEGDAMVAKHENQVTKNELATAQTEIQMLTQKHYAVVAELEKLKAQIQPGIKTPETTAPKKIVKRKRELCFECGLPSHPKDKLEKRTISTRGKPDREEYAHYECWQGWLTKTSRREQGPDSGGVGLFQQRASTFGPPEDLGIMNVADEAIERNTIAVHVDPAMPPGQMLIGRGVVKINGNGYSAKSAIGIERPEFKESDYNGITPEQEKEAIARLFVESK